MMIYFNALWIAIDIEFNKAEMVLKATEPFLIMEILFTLYFSGELFVRWMSYKKTRQAFMDSWFLFDPRPHGMHEGFGRSLHTILGDSSLIRLGMNQLPPHLIVNLQFPFSCQQLSHSHAVFKSKHNIGIFLKANIGICRNPSSQWLRNLDPWPPGHPVGCHTSAFRNSLGVPSWSPRNLWASDQINARPRHD